MLDWQWRFPVCGFALTVCQRVESLEAASPREPREDPSCFVTDQRPQKTNAILFEGLMRDAYHVTSLSYGVRHSRPVIFTREFLTSTTPALHQLTRLFRSGKHRAVAFGGPYQ